MGGEGEVLSRKICNFAHRCALWQNNQNSNTPFTGMKVLIVGAGGFVGGFLAEEALRLGHEVWAGVRPSTSRRYLSDPRLKFVEFSDYDNAEAIAKDLSEAMPGDETWDWIVYNLGATKCTNFADFNRINYGYLRNFLEALTLSTKKPERFLYISSLSALGKGDEKGYTPLTDRMIPNPDTRYGLSKIKAETLLDTNTDLCWTIFRPTGIYGPHEQDYLMMIKAIARHVDFGVGFRKQLLTFIYVEDLARAVFEALQSPATCRKKYIISEPKAYTQKEFRKIVTQALGMKFVVPVRIPLWLTKVVSVVAEKIGVLTMKPSTLNSDKYKIMKQRNWNCDITPAVNDFGFSPRVSLPEGIRLTVAAMRENQ